MGDTPPRAAATPTPRRAPPRVDALPPARPARPHRARSDKTKSNEIKRNQGGPVPQPPGHGCSDTPPVTEPAGSRGGPSGTPARSSAPPPRGLPSPNESAAAEPHPQGERWGPGTPNPSPLLGHRSRDPLPQHPTFWDLLSHPTSPGFWGAHFRDPSSRGPCSWDPCPRIPGPSIPAPGSPTFSRVVQWSGQRPGPGKPPSPALPGPSPKHCAKLQLWVIKKINYWGGGQVKSSDTRQSGE